MNVAPLIINYFFIQWHMFNQFYSFLNNECSNFTIAKPQGNGLWCHWGVRVCKLNQKTMMAGIMAGCRLSLSASQKAAIKYWYIHINWHKQWWSVGPPDQDFRKITVSNLYCLILTTKHHLWAGWKYMYNVDQLGICGDVIAKYMKGVFHIKLPVVTWHTCKLLHHTSASALFIPCFTWVLLKIAPWPSKLGQGCLWQGASKLFTRCTCGMNINTISEFLLEILNLHCFTKNSHVTLRSRPFMARHAKDLY